MSARISGASGREVEVRGRIADRDDRPKPLDRSTFCNPRDIKGLVPSCRSKEELIEYERGMLRFIANDDGMKTHPFSTSCI
jgi:hypothetical protein